MLMTISSGTFFNESFARILLTTRVVGVITQIIGTDYMFVS